jgi:tetratricopeptide (TPR) repeat protein
MRKMLLLLVLALPIAAGWWKGASMAAEAPVTAAFVEDARIRDHDIRFYEARVAQDPASAADHAQFAALLLQRAREGGGWADYRVAEQAARRSLELRTDRNGKAALVLASSLLAQHRFPEALATATGLCPDASAPVAHCALLAEIRLEMGHYDEARVLFHSLANRRETLAVAPRLARWYEIRGETERAMLVLEAARAQAVRRTDLPREQVAWFHLRVGDIALRNGRLREAERAFRDGLAVEPGDARIAAAVARLCAARGQWHETIRWATRAGAGADLATRALIGDARAALGDLPAAERAYADAERFAEENTEPFNRQWTLFRLDHGRHLAETLALLREEIQVRGDVYGWDQLAWALYLNGEFASARAASAQAMRMGTRDAMLYFHAGMIERALGNTQFARQYLERALAVNPRFHPQFAQTTRALLAALNDTAQ